MVQADHKCWLLQTRGNKVDQTTASCQQWKWNLWLFILWEYFKMKKNECQAYFILLNKPSYLFLTAGVYNLDDSDI